MAFASGMMVGWRGPLRMRIVSLFVVLFASSVLQAQGRFPSLQGEYADGRLKELPGQPSEAIVIGLAVSKKAQADLESWYEPAYARFVAKHGLFANAYTTEVYFVPLFTGLNKAGYEPSLKRYRKSATPEVVDRVVFAKADSDEVLGALGIKDRDVPHFFVVGRDGAILSQTSGRFTLEKLEKMEETLLDQ